MALKVALVSGILATLIGGARPARAQNAVEVASPDGRLTIRFEVVQGRPHYSVSRDERAVIEPSLLGFEFRDAPPLGPGLELVGTERRAVDETWKPVWGQRSSIRNHCSELTVNLRESGGLHRELTIVFRAYDDGVGFRYVLPEQPNLAGFAITEEVTRFRLAGDHIVWWSRADYDSYEHLYNETRLSGMLAANTPITMRAADGLHLCITEAALYDYADMTLEPTPGEPLTLRSVLVPWPDWVRVYGRTPFATPWRVVLIADRAGGLIESSLVLNLNEPCVLEDTSWIRPMNYLGIWWGMHIGRQTWAQGPTHGATTANARGLIDFASEHGFDAVLIEGWNTGWEKWGSKDAFDFVTPYPDFDLPSVARYASERGVALVGHHETGGDVPSYERMLQEAFAQCERLGIHAVKTGYAGGIFPRGQYHHGQWMVNHYQRVVEAAARHRIVLDVHEPIKPTGVERTYPNMMTREGARGQEYNAWSEGNPPSHTATLPFTRIVAGPLDYTPGILGLRYTNASVERSVHSTVANQLALMVVLYSPMQMAADLIENYEGHPAFAFAEAVPCDWDETRALGGEIGDFATIARRSGRDWFIGSITDEFPRTLEVPLSFLEPGVTYRAFIVADGPGAHYEENPEPCEIREATVTAADMLTLDLAAGGGCAVWLAPSEQAE